MLHPYSAQVLYRLFLASPWAPLVSSYHSVRGAFAITLSDSHGITPDIDDFAKALESVFQGKATVLNRMRLACTFYDKDLKKIGNEGDGACILRRGVHTSISFHRLASDE